ncbi:hypothetical protein GCM10010191_73520 [Actinomadura vinacea]|uniref:ATPase AAA-type core domain-containing protein n=1 Tax=Actinomadura vinacea TaxID=115336 RepID=A0ABP5X5F3_9ACTN
MRRVSVVGPPGAGKTTLAKALAERLDLPHVELDAIVFQPGWTQLPAAELHVRLGGLAATDAWIMDGNADVLGDEHGTGRRLIWERADTVIWLRPSRQTVVHRLFRRSLTRVVRRTELWNGNREQWRMLLSPDPRRSVIARAYVRYEPQRRAYEAALGEERWSHLRVVRLESARSVKVFLDGVGRRR